MTTILTTAMLAERWGLENETLEKWRQEGLGPPYFKLGRGKTSRIRYHLSEIEDWEKKMGKKKRGKNANTR
jgi:hypothetical protein